MQTCDICQIGGHYKLRSMGNFVWACGDCVSKKHAEPFKHIPGVVQTKWFPSLGNVSVARINEMERRQILPYEKPGGGYYLGRRMENGKISENKHADYRP